MVDGAVKNLEPSSGFSDDWHWYVAWRPGFPAILRIKHPDRAAGMDGSLKDWFTRTWSAFGGAAPVISDVNKSALEIAARWRQDPRSWSGAWPDAAVPGVDGYLKTFSAPLWVVAREDGSVELTDSAPTEGLVSAPLRPFESEPGRTGGSMAFDFLVWSLIPRHYHSR
jgi:hypothetical protein